MIFSVLKKNSVCHHRGYYSLVMGAFTLLDIEAAINGEIRARVHNTAVEITMGCRLTLDGTRCSHDV